MSLKDRKIIIGLTGGIAAYKTPLLIRLLKKDLADVRAIMTTSAAKFTTTLTIETVSQNPVAMEMFPNNRFVGTHHIDMAEWPDLFIIAPATANFIAKIAAGICDDLLTTVICATRKPVIIAPAMNNNMYLNPITQRNVDYLRSLGYIFINPGEGDLACNTKGTGRMAEPEEIHAFIRQFLEKKKTLNKKRILVTAGPCREAIGPVRFISNRSSGKMGFEIAAAARRAGGIVTLISGPTCLPIEPGIELVKVETTAEMAVAVRKKSTTADILIMAAAPADFVAEEISSQKIKKGGNLTLKLKPAIDILQSLKKLKKKGQIAIGFALETEKGPQNAASKLEEKGLDMIILNMAGDNGPFESDSNKVTLIYRDNRTEELPRMSKRELAEILIERIAVLEK
jgi:phosphopantothenoylcysteine decarboxylase / phosphopantothenate---cysteine ligase